MSKAYRELVAVQATFSKTQAQYHLTHFYKWQSDEWTSGGLMIEGYAMDRTDSVEDVTLSIRAAYQGATIKIWQEDALAGTAELLSFKVDVTPASLGLVGSWTPYAQL